MTYDTFTMFGFGSCFAIYIAIGLGATDYYSKTEIVYETNNLVYLHCLGNNKIEGSCFLGIGSISSKFEENYVYAFMNGSKRRKK